MINVRVTGLNKFIRRNKKYIEQYHRDIKKAHQITSLELESGSKRRLKAQLEKDALGSGGLLSSITAEHSGVFAMVYTNKFYAPYVEFGTGAYAKDYLQDKDKEMRDYAYKFYVDGSGTTPARPFMFPTAYEVKPKHIKRLKKIIRG